MKALLFEGPNRMEVREVPTPCVRRKGDLLVKVAACLICGTDIRIYRGKKTKDVRIPSILGHEFSGIIAETGGNVDGFQIGDPVSIAPVLPCLTCYNCKHGQENVCLNGLHSDTNMTARLRNMSDPCRAIRSGNVYHAPSGVDLEGVALAEPLACCINGHGNSPVKLGDTVVVMGAGPIGLMHMLLAKQSGARVIVSEPSAARRNDSPQPWVRMWLWTPRPRIWRSIVSENTGGVGADVVILAIGVPALVNQAIDITRKRGWVNLFAGFSVGDMPPVDVNKIHYRETRVTGTSASSRRDHEVA